MLKKRVLVFVLATSVACAEGDGSHRKAMEEWRKNERVLDVVVARGEFEPEQFLKAVIFFEKTTGLGISGNTTTFGFLPDKKTASNFAKIKKWCHKNCSDLCWDDKLQSVKLDPNCGNGA